MKLIEKTLNLAVDIQQVPAPTSLESKRADFITAKFQSEGLADVFKDEIHNVYARLPGESTKKNLVISAHLDTVFPIATDLTVKVKDAKIFGPGIGDNSLGVAGLFGLLWSLRAKKIILPYDLWFVANVEEEGLGNLRGMKEVVKRFGNDPLAYIVLEGMGLGTIYHRGLGVTRFRVTAKAQGGHSWVDYGAPSAIHELVNLSHSILQIKIPSDPSTSINIGTINGGTSINTIASEASIEIDMRSEQEKSLNELVEKVEILVEVAKRKGVSFEIDKIGDRPAGELPKDHPLVALAYNIAKKNLGVADADLKIGSTDANIPLSLGMPAICIGLTLGGRAHTTDEFILTEPLKKGLDQLEKLVLKIFSDLA